MTRSDPGPSNGGPVPPARPPDPCGQCGGVVGPRALFCHACGAVLPPAALDPFTRLGLERRLDLDPAQIARQYSGFARAFAGDRFADRDAAQRANASAQAAALADALATLTDPIRRAHALRALQGGSPEPTSGTANVPPIP
jgi:molecular chaperone HscB